MKIYLIIFLFLVGCDDIISIDDSDCNGDVNGSAFINNCGLCVGGNTEVDVNMGLDCLGDCFGNALIDNCGICHDTNNDLLGYPDEWNQTCTGCMDDTACNFNVNNLYENNYDCIYPELNYDCSGQCSIDTNCEGICNYTELTENSIYLSANGEVWLNTSIPLQGLQFFIPGSINEFNFVNDNYFISDYNISSEGVSAIIVTDFSDLIYSGIIATVNTNDELNTITDIVGVTNNVAVSITPYDCDLCNGGNINCDNFSAYITLTDNSIPLSGADVFIKYTPSEFALNNFNNINRATQAISYSLPQAGYLTLNAYDLDYILVNNLIDEFKSPGYYNYSYQPDDTLAPFGLSVIKLVLEFEEELFTAYSVLNTSPDFNEAKNLGQTNSIGQFVVGPDYLKSYNLPTFYNIPGITQIDHEGNELGEFQIEDLIDVIIDFLGPIKEEYTKIIGDKAYLAQVLSDGSEKASLKARRTLSKVYRKVGFVKK